MRTYVPATVFKADDHPQTPRKRERSKYSVLCQCGYSPSVLALSLRIELAVLANTSTASQYDTLLSRPQGLKASSFKTFATIARSPYMEFLLPLLLTSLGISPLHAATTCAHVYIHYESCICLCPPPPSPLS